MSGGTTMRRSLNFAWLLLFLSGVAYAVVPTAPTNLSATAVSATQINLTWTDNSNNETSFKIERKTGSGGTYVQIATTGASAEFFSNTGLTAGTTYFYRVRASNSSGNSAYTNQASASTPAPDTIAPTTPTGLTATAVSPAQVDLSWTPSTDNVGVTGYYVEQCRGAGCTGFSLVQFIDNTAPITFPAHIFIPTPLPSTSNSFRVRAADAAGNFSAYSSVTSVTTPNGIPGATPPTVPSAVTATATRPDQINLQWLSSTDAGDSRCPHDGGGGSSTVGYLVERCQGANCGSFAAIQSSDATPLFGSQTCSVSPGIQNATDFGLSASSSYSYRMRALTSDGRLSAYSNVVTATTPATQDLTPPTAPTSLTAIVSGPGQVDLNWNASTDNVNVNAYVVQYCAASCISSVVTGDPAAATPASTRIFGLSPSTDYTFQVFASDAAGNNSGGSNVVSLTSSSDTTTAPGAPTGLTGTSPGPNQINLSWAAPAGNVAVYRYVVSRCQGAGCIPSGSASKPVPTFTSPTSLSDTGLDPGTSYSYQVVAVAGNLVVGPATSVLTVTTQGTDTTPPTAPTGLTLALVGANASQINLSWTASTDAVGVALYRVERCQGANCATFDEVATPSGTSFSDYGLAVATTYSYRARASDAAGNLSAFSSIASVTTLATADTTPPAAPTGLTATTVSISEIDLTWTASTDDVGVTGYRVERCQGTGCANFVEIATPTVTTFSDTTVTVATSYSYRVRASDSAGNLSAYSDVASATTAGAAQVQGYYIYPDHLSTPRLVENGSGIAVWRWDQTEPFGSTPPNNNPSGAGTFEFNVRFPGQYFDRETNLAYNYFRDYDPSIGRYVQSDPIGLVGGVNTYAYVKGNPISRFDWNGTDQLIIAGGVRFTPGEFPNPFGHIGIAIEGNGLFSYGNGTPLGSSPLAYVLSQSELRNQMLVLIPTTSAQDAASLAYFLNHPGMNSVGNIDNCAVRTNESLRAAGISNDASAFPGSVAREAASIPGAQTFLIPQGGSIPPALQEIILRFSPPNIP